MTAIPTSNTSVLSVEHMSRLAKAYPMVDNIFMVVAYELLSNGQHGYSLYKGGPDRGTERFEAVSCLTETRRFGDGDVLDLLLEFGPSAPYRYLWAPAYGTAEPSMLYLRGGAELELVTCNMMADHIVEVTGDGDLIVVDNCAPLREEDFELMLSLVLRHDARSECSSPMSDIEVLNAASVAIRSLMAHNNDRSQPITHYVPLMYLTALHQCRKRTSDTLRGVSRPDSEVVSALTTEFMNAARQMLLSMGLLD